MPKRKFRSTQDLAVFIGKFSLVGLSGTAVFLLLMWFLVEQLSINIMLATSMAFMTVVIKNYILHHRWTFKSNKQHRTAMPQFILMSLSGFLINSGIMYYGLSMLPSVHYFIIQGIALITVILWNLTISTKWVFASH